MKVRCIYNTGKALRTYEYKLLKNEMIGRFGTTGFSEFGELTLGSEYLVMGIIIFENFQGYLIDDNGFISASPCQLFEVIDNKLASNWSFRLVEKEEDIYPFIQAIFGYKELCVDKKSYENLIIEKDEEAQQIYFRRKIEIEKELAE